MYIFVREDKINVIYVKFKYNKEIIHKIKKIPNRKWHPESKYWTIPNSNTILKKFLETIKPRNIRVKGEISFFAGKDELINYYSIIYGNLLADKLKLKGYSHQTVKNYTNHIKRFIIFIGEDPNRLIENDINKYILYLKEVKKNSHSFINQFISAAKIFFKEILDKHDISIKINRLKKRKSLPTVLSKLEVKKIIHSLDNIKHKTILSLIYSSGMRVSEVIKLKLKDIDEDRMMIHIRGSKGYKDRYTLLSKTVLKEINLYKKLYNVKSYEGKWLFPGLDKSKHLSARSVQKIFKKACKLTDIKKDVSVHSLRHSFATHLLEQGVDLRYIQELLGHKSSKTTEIYTHVSKRSIKKIVNPIDEILDS